MNRIVFHKITDIENYRKDLLEFIKKWRVFISLGYVINVYYEYKNEPNVMYLESTAIVKKIYIYYAMLTHPWLFVAPVEPDPNVTSIWLIISETEEGNNPYKIIRYKNFFPRTLLKNLDKYLQDNEKILTEKTELYIYVDQKRTNGKLYSVSSFFGKDINLRTILTDQNLAWWDGNNTRYMKKFIFFFTEINNDPSIKTDMLVYNTGDAPSIETDTFFFNEITKKI